MCFGAREFRIYADGREVGRVGRFTLQETPTADAADVFVDAYMPQQEISITFTYDPRRANVALYRMNGGDSRRAAHLALHGRTERVRKKNYKRIIREMRCP